MLSYVPRVGGMLVLGLEEILIRCLLDTGFELGSGTYGNNGISRRVVDKLVKAG